MFHSNERGVARTIVITVRLMCPAATANEYGVVVRRTTAEFAAGARVARDFRLPLSSLHHLPRAALP